MHESAIVAQLVEDELLPPATVHCVNAIYDARKLVCDNEISPKLRQRRRATVAAATSKASGASGVV